MEYGLPANEAALANFDSFEGSVVDQTLDGTQ
jgi:hypothetical protein